MAKTNVEIVRELLGGVLDPEVVRRLTAPNVVYVSLTYDNPELQKLMPQAGVHRDGRAGIIESFREVNRRWHIEDFDVQDIFGEDDQVAVFGSFVTTL